jgi:radical SAM superfamily enzyme YgiQ (UPF0313 family)/MoaA/NifB/PqqE/SkfB family radical SAM enzyme
MRLKILYYADIPTFFEHRVRRITKILQCSSAPVRLHASTFEHDAEVYILLGWYHGFGYVKDLARQIKSQIKDAPLLWCNEYSIDSTMNTHVSPGVCDGFIHVSDFESVSRDLCGMDDLIGLMDLPGLVVNCKEGFESAVQRLPRRSFPQEVYQDGKTDFAGFQYIPTAFGCESRCRHCSIVSREGFRRRMPSDELFELVTSLHHDKRIRKFHFVDHYFNAEYSELFSFAKALAESDIKVEWRTGFQFESISEEDAALLARSGLRRVKVPLFTGSDRVAFKNGISHRVKDCSLMLERFSKVGIEVELAVYSGLPGEQESDFFRTVDFIRENQEWIHSITGVTPVRIEPNSYHWRRHEESGIGVEPGNYDSWVLRENDGQNEIRVRQSRCDFLRQQGLDLGLMKGNVAADTSALQRRYQAYLRHRLDVVLVTTPPWGVHNPPVGLAKLGAWLKFKGRKYRLLDYNVKFHEKYTDYQRLWHVENKSYWGEDRTFEVIRHIFDQDIDQAVDEILDLQCDVVGFSVVDPKERITIEFIKRLKARNSRLKIIIGGPVCFTPHYLNVFYDKLGMDGVDAFVAGEGEETLIEVLDYFETGRSIEGLPGTVRVDADGKWHYAPYRKAMDLKVAPITTYEEFSMEDYNCQELLLEWSRGCIGRCSFCKARELCGTYRSYALEHIVDSLQYYTSQYGIYEFTVCDLEVNGDLKLLRALCEKLIELDLKVKIKAEAIPRAQMTKELLELMKKAGFIELQWGIESGSDSVLKLMNKGHLFTVEEAQEVVRNSYLAGIKTCLFVIVGYPGETDEDALETYKFIDRNAEYIDQVKSVNSLHIITDTEVHNNAEKLGIHLPDENYHYLWEMKGNTIEIRNERIKSLLSLIQEKGIEVLETNLLEGRQVEASKSWEQESISLEQRAARLRQDIHQLIDYSSNEQETYESSEDPKDAFLEDNRELMGAVHGKKAFSGPSIVEIDLTNNCNFNCIACWVHSDLLEEMKTSAAEKRKYIPLDIMKSLVDDLVKMGKPVIQLAGPGEPFMHPEIMEIIRYIKGNGLELHIITNFSKISHEIAKELMDLKVDQLTVSLWAGSEKVWLELHPNQKKEAFESITNVLTYIGNHKKYNQFPRIKIYNVICSKNAADLENMVEFGLQVRADQMEFTVVDTVSGKTDSLALSLEDVEVIQKQFDSITKKATYPDPPGRKHLQGLSDEQMQEHYEVNSRFFTDIGEYQGFEYEPVNKVMTCREGFSNIRMGHDPDLVCANIFYFDPEICGRCAQSSSCEVDKETHSIKTRFFAVLGFGSFMRRARESVASNEKESTKAREEMKSEVPFVDTLPCTVGWSYSRITTSGDVIPCCKGYGKIMGNLFKNRFETIWYGNELNEFRFKAKNFRKSDPYFDVIGCYKSCDNVGHNLALFRRLQGLKPRERQWLEKEAKRLV